MVIWFNSKKAREQLIRDGIVVTCRKQRKTFGTTLAIFRDDAGYKKKICYVDVQYLIESWDEQREHDKPFSDNIHLSGFDSVEEWKEEVRRLNNNRWMPQFLIFLKVTRDSELY